MSAAAETLRNPVESRVLLITKANLEEVFHLKHGDQGRLGPVPRMWLRFGYTVPDNFYEAAIAKLVRSESTWLDVGCGRCIFPQNPQLASQLAQRCRTVVGVDPDRNVDANPFVHHRVRDTIENYRADQLFDVVSLRMVAEHVEDPKSVIQTLARLTKPGGKVVIYTVNKWSPVALLAKATPIRLHHMIKRLMWGVEDRDTFPVRYRMNTRQRLTELFKAGGFREHSFQYLDDATLFFGFPRLHRFELTLWRLFKALGLRYPENCLLAIYERT